MCKNQQLLCNYSFTSKAARNNLEIGASFNEQQLDDAISHYVQKCEVGDNKQHFVSGLYMMLCVCGSDGLGSESISKYYTIADKMGFSKEAADQILNTYHKECDLISSFNDIYDMSK